MKKKILAGILSLCMIFSIMPMSVFAETGTNVAKISETEYSTLKDAIDAVGAGDVVIELIGDATLDYSAREAYGTVETTSVTINGNGKTLTLNQTNNDWSSLGLANADAKLVLNNITIEKTGYGDTNGAWNKHAINIHAAVEMNNVTVNNSVAVKVGAKLINVTINEAGDYYGLWITANGQTVSVNGGTINATNGRGIKIADQYVDNIAKVTLSVDGTKFNTAKKAAVLVTSTEGADITATNVDISNVAADSTNFAWVDEDRMANSDKVTVNGEPTVAEGAVAMIGSTSFKTLAEAVAAVNEGSTVTLLDDVAENITIAESKNFTIDLKGKTLTGSILANAGTTVEIKNGTIINTNSDVSAVETAGKLTLTNVNITSARHAVRVDGDNADVTIDGGIYKVSGTAGMTTHAVNVGNSTGCTAKATIKNGVFIGPKDTPSESGSAINIQAGSTVTIENGDFSGGKNNSSSLTGTLKVDGTLNVYGGKYDVDPTNYVVTGYHVCTEDSSSYVVHKVNSVDVVPATCKVTGTAAHYKCEAGKLYSDAKGTQEITDPTTLVIAVVPHTSKDVAAVAPTCTETGLTAGTACSVCGDVLTAQQTVAATDHSWGEWTVTTAPSCTEKGVETRVCANDSTHKETRDVAAKGHVWGYNTQYDAAAHWNHCHICGAQGELTAHSDANHDGYCDCGWSMTSAPGRANPNTGVHY